MNHSGVQRLRTARVVPTAKLNLAAALAALLAELEPWRRELGQDITRATDRNLLALAADLTRLRAHVERTHGLGRTLQRALERPA